MKPIADLCDELGGVVAVAEPLFRDYGGVTAFDGKIVTLATEDDNTKVRRILSEPGDGRVLVVDGRGSRNCALLGGNLGKLAETNGWSGVVVNGCVRDTAELAQCRIGVKALAAHPRKSRKEDAGQRDAVVQFAGVTFNPGHRLVADGDGVVVLSPDDLP